MSNFTKYVWRSSALALALGSLSTMAEADEPVEPAGEAGSTSADTNTAMLTGVPTAASTTGASTEPPAPSTTLTSVAPEHSLASPSPAAKPAPYSLPWQLRPVTVGNVLRSDTSVAFFDGPDTTTGERGATVSSMLLASYRLTPRFAPLVRAAFVYNDEPATSGAAPSGSAVVNPLVGGTYAVPLAGLKVAAFGAVTLPIGQGGGDSPDAAEATAALRGIPARSAMDNAMFATNYFTLIAGVGAAYIEHGVTGQLEATVLQLIHVRGPDSEDAARTNFTAGAHAGYFLLPQLSIGGEIRYQRWLSDAAPVIKNPAARETVTVAIGPRLHLKVGNRQWLRPGISYSRVLDAPWSRDAYQIVQVDLPFAF